MFLLYYVYVCVCVHLYIIDILDAEILVRRLCSLKWLAMTRPAFHLL